MKAMHDTETDEFPALEDVFAKHFGPSPPRVRVTFGAQSHPGRLRPNNEDHYLVIERRRTRSVLLTNLPQGFLRPADDVAYVLAVADGMGGAAFGELASMLALRSGWDQSPYAIKWSWIINDREVEELKQRVEIIFQRIDASLKEQAQREPAYAGMGTTLTGAYTVGPEAFVAHAGDSRAYLFHAGVLTQLTHDHTLAQQYLDVGMIPSRSLHHVLTNCLGASGQGMYVDYRHFHLADNDQLLLCTDGLTDSVRVEEIAHLLRQNLAPQDAARRLVEMALDRGGEDNVTVVLARYEIPAPS
jgi:PPM family protein phosphatase